MSIQSIVQQYHPSKKLLLLIGLFLVWLGVASIVQVLIILPFTDLKSISNLDFTNPKIINAMKMGQAVSAILAFIVPTMLFAYMSSEKKFAYLKLNNGFSMILGLATVILVFAAMPVINWTGELNSHLTLPSFMSGLENWIKSSEESAKKIMDTFLQMNGITDLIVNIIIIALLAAVGEELLFRGCMQNVFLEWTKNKHIAVWITAILFSALHAQFYGFLPRMLNNGMAVFISYLIGKGSISEKAETIGSGDTPIYFVALSVVICAGLMYVIYKNRKTEPLAISH